MSDKKESEFQLRFPHMSYNIRDNLNEFRFKELEIPLLLSDSGVIHLTPSGYKHHDLLDFTLHPEISVFENYVEDLNAYVNRHYSETDIIDRDFKKAKNIYVLPFIHADMMLYRSYYRLNEKSRVVMVIQRIQQKHFIHDVYFIIHNADLMDSMIKEDINALLLKVKEYV